MNPDEIYFDILALDQVVSAAEAEPRPFLSEENRRLAERALEDLSGAHAQWLGNAVPVVEELLAKAKDATLSDADWVAAVERIAAAMPDLFERLEWQALAGAIEKVQGTAMVNGAVARQREVDRLLNV